jgi:uncharacterized membrane protein
MFLVSGHNLSFEINNKLKDSELISDFLIGTVTVGLFLFSLIAVIFYYQSLHQNMYSLNFDNPVYNMAIENQFALEKCRFPISENNEHKVLT